MHFFELLNLAIVAVDYVVVTACASAGVMAAHVGACALVVLHVLVHLSEQLLGVVHQFLLAGLKGVDVSVADVSLILGSLKDCLEVRDLGFNSCLCGCVDLVADFLQGLLGLEYDGVSFVSRVYAFLALSVLCLELSSFLDRLLDILVGHVGAGMRAGFHPV